MPKALNAADGTLDLYKAFNDIRNGNVLQALEDGTMSFRDFAQVFSADAGVVKAAGYVGAAIGIAIDLQNHDYVHLAIDAISIAYPAVGEAVAIAYAIYSLFQKDQAYYVGLQLEASNISLRDGPTANDSLTYDALEPATHLLTVDLGDTTNSVTAGDGSMTLDADTALGRSQVAISRTQGAQTVDRLVFSSDIAKSDLVFRRYGDDLVVQTKAGGTISFADWFNGDLHKLTNIDFSDGTSWTSDNNDHVTLYSVASDNSPIQTDQQFENNILTGDYSVTVNVLDERPGEPGRTLVMGGTGNDTISVGHMSDLTIMVENGNDTIHLTSAGSSGYVDFGAGNSVLTNDRSYGDNDSTVTYNLGTGNNRIVSQDETATYNFDLGAGNDTISFQALNSYEKNVDQKTVAFGAGINQGDVSYSRNGNDLVLSFGSKAGSLTIEGWFSHSDYRIGQFTFSDGTSLSIDDIKRIPIAYSGTGELEGWDGDDVITAGGADSALTSNGSADGFLSSSGMYFDVLNGGSGNDTFNITNGSFAYVNAGSGQSVVNIDGGASASVHLGSGTGVVNIQTSELDLGNDSVYGGSGNDTIVISGYVPEVDIYTGTGDQDISGEGYATRLHVERGFGDITIHGIENGGSKADMKRAGF